jgi:uncharacterized protein YndB with AHSA1/START domain
MGDREQAVLNGLGVMAPILGQQKRDIVLSFKIEADSGRVLYALSIPEYIEAWLQTPDAGELQLVFNLVAAEAFRIDFYRAGSLQTSVHGSCRVVSANQIRYIWKTTSSTGTTETLVDMQLLRTSGGCTLSLRHSGFRSSKESSWCYKMWCLSLERLSKLIEKN